MRALVIDDDANVSDAIRATLSRRGFEVVLAARAHAGLRALQDERFDVVIVDLLIPGLSGIDTIKAIWRRSPAMPIVAMNGLAMLRSNTPETDFLTAAVQRGATTCIRKPFTPAQLVDAINTSLGAVGAREFQP